MDSTYQPHPSTLWVWNGSLTAKTVSDFKGGEEMVHSSLMVVRQFTGCKLSPWFWERWNGLLAATDSHMLHLIRCWSNYSGMHWQMLALILTLGRWPSDGRHWHTLTLTLMVVRLRSHFSRGCVILKDRARDTPLSAPSSNTVMSWRMTCHTNTQACTQLWRPFQGSFFVVIFGLLFCIGRHTARRKETENYRKIYMTPPPPIIYISYLLNSFSAKQVTLEMWLCTCKNKSINL